MSSGTPGSTTRQGCRPFARAERRIEAAKGYLALDMPEHALRELEEALVPQHCRFHTLKLRADALRRLGRFSEALAAYTRALAERPDALPVLMSTACCYRQLHRLDRAIAAMEEANRFHPDQPAVLFALSRFYVIAGEAERSLSWLGRALRICPEIANLVDADSDFAPLRPDPHFHRLLEVAKYRQTA